ncbi:MAG: protein kinase, partial [Acidobacteria bacterium]|nr:protein kinase [Acidobacteriota bacterium]
MKFGVLGSLVVSDEQGPIDVGGPRQRRLLAALVAHADEIVSTDRLIDIVFEGDPPDGASTTIRSYIARLRRSLEHGNAKGVDLIATEPPGYVLRSDSHIVDAAAFEAIAASGKDLLTGRDAMGAVGLLDEALSLWRGAAYEEFLYEDWARPEALRLEEQRVTSEEDLIEAKLDCGLAEEVIPDLRRLIDEHPVRDRLRAQLMLALYRSGRQVEALRVYDYYRTSLIEVGLEPSEDVLALERSIAAHDPALHLRTPAGRALRGYRLGKTLGEGSHGVVYQGIQPSTGRNVALKAIRSELVDDPAFIRRFDAEAQVVSNLEHPHIVPLYDYWREPGGAYMVMRLLEGDLSERLDRGPMSLDEVGRMARQLGSALTTAHRSGVVHGDIKPSNILVDGDGNVYLADFGLATLIGEGSEHAASPRSSGYESPEFLAGNDPEPASDQFALAILLAQSLTGVLPFGTRAIASPHDRVHSIHTQRSSVPLAVDEIIWKATSWSSDDRFVDVAEFVDHFVAAVGGVAVADRGQAIAPNPYKGLQPFTEVDLADFFGREVVVSEVVARFGRDDAASRFITLIGASGSGKSSIVHAGVVPRLRSGAAPGSRDWFIADMVPGSDPFTALKNSLRPIAVTEPDFDRLDKSEDNRVRAILRAAVDAHQPVLLVLDQLEELFTLVQDEHTRRAFLDGLAEAVTEPESNVRVLATLRADFYDRPLRYHTAGRLLKDGGITIVGMTAAELDQAIREPAGQAGIEVEPALASELVSDVIDQPAALPLLQFALTELFEHRSEGVITRESYRELGGVDAAVSSRAERVFRS